MTPEQRRLHVPVAVNALRWSHRIVRADQAGAARAARLGMANQASIKHYSQNITPSWLQQRLAANQPSSTRCMRRSEVLLLGDRERGVDHGGVGAQ